MNKSGAEDMWVDGADGGFIDPVSMEEDPVELFAGDAGTLAVDVRRVLVRMLQRRYLLAEKSPGLWRTLLDNQQLVESRMHDMFVRLVIDHDRGVAYKEQVRSVELDVPILLKDEPYSRAETLVLVYLRTIFQQEQVAGEMSARVDIEDLEQTVLTYYDPDDTNLARGQQEIRGAVARLAREGLIEEETAGRYRITPLVEIVLSAEKLNEIKSWLHARNEGSAVAVADSEGAVL
ncbi:DUF4194 domain-containing protein [Nocardia stercoris]|uniref:DUF4194 domain-containing protein n=1 Tax=Nocardia stercoris TaxID=2483361 RepID=A0A3M2KY50_9NOCA|nr:DUF4194 domain-containing protein [Nocardia stercoris]RMI28465.1 DUF4194 domain-containing protein [Nocardia stercoris]